MFIYFNYEYRQIKGVIQPICEDFEEDEVNM